MMVESLCRLEWGHGPGLPWRKSGGPHDTTRASNATARHHSSDTSNTSSHALSRPPRPPSSSPLHSSTSSPILRLSQKHSSRPTATTLINWAPLDTPTRRHAANPTYAPTPAAIVDAHSSLSSRTAQHQLWPTHSPTCLAPRLPGLRQSCASAVATRTQTTQERGSWN
ncbi:hypothetical protein BC567DRAFT_24132 [Phyllosticta citribraziliensis]